MARVLEVGALADRVAAGMWDSWLLRTSNQHGLRRSHPQMLCLTKNCCPIAAVSSQRWPGTEWNRRHEDFQFCSGTRTCVAIGRQLNESETLEQRGPIDVHR
jgi:hypothetical protein